MQSQCERLLLFLFIQTTSASPMNKPVSSHAREAKNSPRPSLYGSAQESVENARAFSILNGIEPSRKRRKLTLRMAWGAPLMALAAVLLVAGLNSGFEQFATSDTPSIPASLKVTGKDAVVGRLPAADADNVSLQPATHPAVATIVSDEPKVETAPVTALVPALAALSEVQAASPEVKSGAVPTATAATNAAAPHTSALPTSSDERSVQEKQASLRQAPVIRKDRAYVADAAPPSSKQNPGKDKDVDLIAALLTHVSGGSTQRQSEAPKKSSANSAPTRTSSAALAGKRERNPGTNRDIVTPVPGESTESLVKRCRALGFFEGELCRVRVCSGLWGKEPACPSNAAGSAD